MLHQYLRANAYAKCMYCTHQRALPRNEYMELNDLKCSAGSEAQASELAIRSTSSMMSSLGPCLFICIHMVMTACSIEDDRTCRIVDDYSLLTLLLACPILAGLHALLVAHLRMLLLACTTACFPAVLLTCLQYSLLALLLASV